MMELEPAAVLVKVSDTESSVGATGSAPVTGLSFGNGVTGTYGYDLAYRPTTRVDAGKASVQNLTYEYFANDSVKTITDADNAANSQTLAYDATDWLKTATSGKGGYGTFAFTWDKVGNVKSQTVNGTETAYTYTADTNRLASFKTGTTTETVATTPAGNIGTFEIGSTAEETLVYNKANQVASSTSTSQMASYEYDLTGQRLEKSLPGENPILYQFSRTGGQLLAENDLHKGQTADYIYLNGKPIGEVNPTNGSLYFTHTDRLGTPQTLTDSTQAVAWHTTYQPFGATNLITGPLVVQSLRLPGQQFDPENGFNHNGFRDYAPTITRYVQTDPIGLLGGMNTYQYANANAFKWIDLLGLDGIVFTAPDDPVYEWDTILKEQSPFFVIAGHGGYDPVLDVVDHNNIYFRTNAEGQLSVAQVGNYILASSWDRESIILSDVCFGSNGGEQSFNAQLAQYLARKINAPVVIFGFTGEVETPPGQIILGPGSVLQIFTEYPNPSVLLPVPALE